MRILQSVHPSSEQLTILGSNRPGVMLVRGAAGSGKTTTALLRLKQLCEFWLHRRDRLGLTDPVRVLVLTYNRTLEGYIAELARAQVTGHPGLHLHVSTFGKWALDMLGPVNICDIETSRALLKPLVRPLGNDVDFLVDEALYVLDRFEPGDLDRYLTARREGRGISPRVEAALRERLLADVITPYSKAKADRRLMDWNDIAVAAADVDDVPPWDVIIVDESQDFSANQMRAIAAHLADPGSLTFVMDAVQRIYPRYFTWKEAGISLDETHTLRSNYRNTAQIAAFARPLVEGLPKEDDGALPNFDACSQTGVAPTVVAGKYSDQIDYMLTTLAQTVDFTSESVAFLQPRGGAWFDYLRSRLRKAGIPFAELTRTKEWPSGTEAVALCTLHSAKGLEFDHVAMPGLNAEVTPHGLGADDVQLDGLRRLVAMGIGRSRKSVMLGYKPGEASTVVSLLDPSTYTQVNL